MELGIEFGAEVIRVDVFEDRKIEREKEDVEKEEDVQGKLYPTTPRISRIMMR